LPTQNPPTPADSIFYLKEGKVKLTVLSAQGKEAAVAILLAPRRGAGSQPSRRQSAFGAEQVLAMLI